LRCKTQSLLCAPSHHHNILSLAAQVGRFIFLKQKWVQCGQQKWNLEGKLPIVSKKALKRNSFEEVVHIRRQSLLVGLLVTGLVLGSVGGYLSSHGSSVKKEGGQNIQNKNLSKDSLTSSTENVATAATTDSMVAEKMHSLVNIVSKPNVRVGSLIPDVLKSPKQIYLETEARELSKITTAVDKGRDPFVFSPYFTPNYPTRSLTEITASVSGTAEDDPMTAMIAELLKNSKVIVDSSSDPITQKNYLQLKVNSNNAEVLGIEAFVDKDRIGGKIPAIYDKYLYIDYKDRERFKERFGIELPSNLHSEFEHQNLFQLNKAEVELILSKYAKIYADNLKDNQVVMSDGVFRNGTTNINAKIMTISFTNTQLDTLIEQVADTVANDNQLLDLIYQKYQSFSNLNMSMGYIPPGEVPLTKAEVKQAIRDFCSQLKTTVKNTSVPEGLTMALYVDSQQNILERKVNFGKNNIDLRNWTVGSKTNSAVVFNGYILNSAVMFETNELQQNGKTVSKDLKFKVTESNGANTIDFDSSYANSLDGSTQDLNAQFRVITNSTGQPEEISVKYLSKGKTDLKTKAVVSNANLSFEMKTPSLGINNTTVSFNIKQSVDCIKNVTLPNLQSENSLNLAEASDEQLAEILQRIEEFIGITGGEPTVPIDPEIPPDYIPDYEGFPSDTVTIFSINGLKI
jgi:hypothetical protein